MNGTAEEHATSYGYDAAGRLSQVAASYPLPATPDFTYSYLTNSGSLLESVTGPAHTVTNTYEATRNVLQQKRNTAGDLSQITNTPISNFVYGVNALGQRDDVNRTGSAFTTANTETWNYNAKGEVVTANSSNNAFDRSYEFDGIGNRKKSADSITLPAADNYSANTLNQLTTVNGGARIHDADGNITDNGIHLYTWDAENRLIEIKLKSDNSTVATYAYDSYSRRITKTVGSTETNFVYEGWNPIAEFTGTTLSKTYTWGMDLSGSMQGAGGVGGLLSVNDGSASYYPTYDGNGNVSEYVGATGAVVAHYEYDAFGQVVASGTMKDDFTHQFSTKVLDAETGFHYYGFRYYNSKIGRWLGRDPMQERGGSNLYSFLGNHSITLIDLLGLIEVRIGRQSIGGPFNFRKKQYESATASTISGCCLISKEKGEITLYDEWTGEAIEFTDDKDIEKFESESKRLKNKADSLHNLSEVLRVSGIVTTIGGVSTIMVPGWGAGMTIAGASIWLASEIVGEKARVAREKYRGHLDKPPIPVIKFEDHTLKTYISNKKVISSSKTILQRPCEASDTDPGFDFDTRLL